MSSGGGIEFNNGLTLIGSWLKLSRLNAGPRYCAHSLPVSAAVTLATADICAHRKNTGSARFETVKTPVAPPDRGSNML